MSEELIKLNKKDPLLTISLLTSNRIDTIRKCLDSITELRKVVPSELIIVDTGCDDTMRSIIEEYTDHIIKFEWCNDFSAARNVSIDAAKGKWYMYLDDDEWFEDTKEIQFLFTSKKNGRFIHEDFNACCYIQRNYINKNGLMYSDDPVSRIIKLTPDVKFIGKIHEYLYGFGGKYTSVKSYVHHYGYIFETDKEKYMHSSRNIIPLKESIEEEPDNIRWWSQLAQEYEFIKDYNALYNICQEALSKFTVEITKDKNVDKEAMGFYAARLESDYCSYQYAKCVSDAEEALKDDRINLLSAATIYIYLAKSLENLGQYEDMKKYCLLYFELYDRYHDDQKILIELSCLFVGEAFSRRYYELMCWIMIIYGIRTNNIEIIKEYFEKINWKAEALFVYKQDTILELIDYIANTKFDKWYVDAVNTIMSRGDQIEKCCSKISEYEKGNDIEKFNRLVKVFSYTPIHESYIDYIKILATTIDGSSTYGTKNNEWLFNQTKLLVNETNKFLYFRKIFWDILIFRNIDISAIIRSIDFNTWRYAVDDFFDNNEDIDRLFMIDNIINEEGSSDIFYDIRYDYFNMRCIEASIYSDMVLNSNYDMNSWRRSIKYYIKDTRKYYDRIIRSDVQEDCLDALPNSLRLAIILSKGLKLESENKIKDAISMYRSGIGLRTKMDEFLLNYSAVLFDQI